MYRKFSGAYKAAKRLPYDAPVYSTDKEYQAVVTKRHTTPVNVFRAQTRRKRQRYGDGFLYVDDSGEVPVLMYHAKWARNELVITKVSFEIVGLKRKTKHVPAGVLITNIKYEW